MSNVTLWSVFPNPVTYKQNCNSIVTFYGTHTVMYAISYVAGIFTRTFTWIYVYRNTISKY